MKNIISRKDFLNENIKDYDSIKELIFEFVEEENFNSFSEYFRSNGDDDIEKLKIYLLKKGIHLDWFMENYKEEIYKDYHFTEANGFFDYLLYTYDNRYLLYGAEINASGVPDDIIIKYFYGYQNKKLGKLYLYQNYNSLSDFYKDCADNFPEYLEDSLGAKVNKNIHLTINEKNYSVCCIDINKDEFDNIKHDINLWNFKTYIHKDNVLYALFGDNIVIDNEKIRKWKDEFSFNKNVNKYNL